MIETTGQAAARPLRADAVRNRERILTAASTVFARHGLASTLDQVADEAGVGVGTVYRRFSGRDELVRLVFEQRLTTIADRWEAVSLAPDPWAALLAGIDEVAAELVADRALRQLIEAVDIPDDPVLAAVHTRLEAAGARVVQSARQHGHIRPDAVGIDIGVIIRCTMAAADMTQGDGWRRYLALMLDGLQNVHSARELPPAALLPQDHSTTAS